MRYLKQNTAVRVTVGPFIDDTDGLTPLDSMTVTGITAVLVYDDDDGTVPTHTTWTCAASGSDNDLVAIGHCGMWETELTAANTNFTGRMILCFTDADQICPVWHEFQVLTANVYDSLFAGAGPTADILDVSVTQWAGTALHARVTEGVPVCDIHTIAADAIDAASIKDAAIDLATFAADCKTGSALKANVETITNDAITAASINTGAFTADAFAADAIVAATLATGAITADAFAADAIVAATLATDAITSDAIAASAVTEIQNGLATPTNITAGTITTVTNLTNAPTSGDLTSTMKTSVTAAVLSAAGTGANTWTYTLTDADTAAAIAGAMVWITSDLAGSTIVASSITNASGVATFVLDAGTYYVWRQKSGYNFTNPDQETIS